MIPSDLSACDNDFACANLPLSSNALPSRDSVVVAVIVVDAAVAVLCFLRECLPFFDFFDVFDCLGLDLDFEFLTIVCYGQLERGQYSKKTNKKN